ncbi:hypothetical protein TNCT_375991, partial [Trichonephila clavata]
MENDGIHLFYKVFIGDINKGLHQDHTIEELTTQTQSLAIVYTEDSSESNLNRGSAGVFFISPNREPECHKVQ